jgi:hypothetical protein
MHPPHVVQITNRNGICYAEEFLEILGWFSKWERWVSLSLSVMLDKMSMSITLGMHEHLWAVIQIQTNGKRWLPFQL